MQGRIVIRFPRPLIITFGFLVFLSACILTAAIGGTVAWVIQLLWSAVSQVYRWR
jgi:hypothetical protein